MTTLNTIIEEEKKDKNVELLKRYIREAYPQGDALIGLVDDILTTAMQRAYEAWAEAEREQTTISYLCKDELYTDFYKCDSCGYSNITPSDSYCGGCGRMVAPTKTDKQP